MKRTAYILPGTPILLAVFMLSACPQEPGSPDSEITDFSFTPQAGLQAGTEGADAGALAGTFSVTGGTEPYVYSLAMGSEGNDVDNDNFKIEDGTLKIGDYPLSASSAATPYKVYLRVADSNGKIGETAGEIAVSAAEPGSSGTAITNYTFAATVGLKYGDENVASGKTAGSITAVAQGGSQTDLGGYTFTLAAIPGNTDADNGKFALNDSALDIGAAALVGGPHRVYIRVADTNGWLYGKSNAITVAVDPDQKSHRLTSPGYTALRAVSSSTSIATVTLADNQLAISSKAVGDFDIYTYDADHYEIAVTGLSVGSNGQITGTPVETKSAHPVYNSVDKEGGSVFDEIKGKTSGTYLLRGAPTRPPVDENGKSDWGIPDGVTLVLMNGSTWHMHTQYNYTGPGTFKYEATSGNATMLPGGTPGNGYTFQVSTLEIGGTLWLVGGIERIYGAMTSPGGIVRMLGGTTLLTGESGSQTLTVTDTAEHGGAYWHVIVKNLVLGSSTLTIKDAITFAAVTVTENATYGSNAFTMNSSALGMGDSGASLVINAPGKTVTVKSIDCENGKLASIAVQAGTLAVTDEGGLVNTDGAAITVSPGASLTINGVPYTPES
jgi:hypothetical protein